MTDNAGAPNIYTQTGSIYAGTGNGGHYALFDDLAVANGSLTKTTVNLTGTPAFFGLSCYETTGPSEVVDGPVGTGSSLNGLVSATLNPTGSSDFSSCGVTSSNRITPGAGYTAIATAPLSPTTSMYKVLSGPGTQSATATIVTGTDMICATYGSSSSAPATNVISAVTATAITSSSATITWTTSQPSSSQVEYGPTSYSSMSAFASSAVTSHSVTLTGLTAGTTYNYAVLGQNSTGTLTTSANFTLATTATAPIPPSTPPSGGGSSIAVTGKTCSNFSYGTSTTCNWSAPPAVGESNHCFVFNFGATTAFGVSDNAGAPNIYAQNGSVYFGTGSSGYYALFDALNVTNGSLTSTTAKLLGTGVFFGLSCYSTTGGLKAVDGPAVGASAQNGALTATINPPTAGDFASCGVSSSSNFTPATGFTPRSRPSRIPTDAQHL